MIDVHHESVMSIDDACKTLRAAPCTIHRYFMHGVGGVTLESIKMGGRRVTSREAISRFITRLNAPAVEPHAVAAPGDIDMQRMEAELDSALSVA